MAYKAYLNNNLFFDTSGNDVSFLLTAAKLDLEAGSSGTFTFKVPPGNQYYGSFRKLIDYIDVYRDDELLLSGRVYSIKKKFDTQYEIVCEGLLSVLADSIFRPVTFDGTLHNLVRAIINSHNSQVESSKQITIARLGITDASAYRDYQNYDTSISRLKDLFESFGGYPYIVKTNQGLQFYWLDHMEVGSEQKIELGSNLLDLDTEDTSDGVCTVLIPVGGEDESGNPITIASVNSGRDYLVADNTYIQKYGYVTKVQEWPDVNVPSILKTKGQQFLNASLAEKLTINVTALDLADAGYSYESFRVGQQITVTSELHGIQNEVFDCQRQSLDLLAPENNRLTLGMVKIGYVRNSNTSQLAALISKLSSVVTRSAMDLAIENATNLITGNSGGYLVWHDADGDNLPDEALIMDTKDITTARRIWRANLSGIGYSSTGYNGSYGTAITMDGGIVGSFLTALSVTAEKIAAGAITADKIAANAVTAVKINSGAVTADKIAANAVTAVKINSGAVTTDKLAANAVTAAKINVTDLFSQNITASNFNITGGSINISTSSETVDKINLNYSAYESAVGKTVNFYSQLRPYGMKVYSNQIRISSNQSNLGAYCNYQGHIFGFNINGYETDNQRVLAGGIAYSSTYGYRGFLQIRKGRFTDLLVEVCEGTTAAGWVGVHNTSGSTTVSMDGDGGICSAYTWTTLSDRNRKRDITYLDAEDSADFIYSLKPARFQYKNINQADVYHHGFIAQDVEDVTADKKWSLVTYTTPNKPASKGDEEPAYKTLAYSELIADIVATLQKQHEEIGLLKQMIGG